MKVLPPIVLAGRTPGRHAPPCPRPTAAERARPGRLRPGRAAAGRPVPLRQRPLAGTHRRYRPTCPTTAPSPSSTRRREQRARDCSKSTVQPAQATAPRRAWWRTCTAASWTPRRSSPRGLAPLAAELARIDAHRQRRRPRRLTWATTRPSASTCRCSGTCSRTRATPPPTCLGSTRRTVDARPRLLPARPTTGTPATARSCAGYAAQLLQRPATADAAAGAGRASWASSSALAEAQWTRVQNRDPVAHLQQGDTARQLARLAPGFDWNRYLRRRRRAGAGGHRQPAELPDGARTPCRRESRRRTGRPICRYRLLDQLRALPAGSASTSCISVSTSARCRASSSSAPRWKRGVDAGRPARWARPAASCTWRRTSVAAAKQRMQQLVANLLRAYRQLDRRARLDEPGDARRGAAASWPRFTVKIGYPDKWRDYSGLRDRAPATWLGNVAARRAVRAAPPAEPARQAGRPQRVAHDAADGERLLQPAAERDRVPGRDPAAAVLRRRAPTTP